MKPSQKVINLAIRASRRLLKLLYKSYCYWYNRSTFYAFNVKIKRGYKVNGILKIIAQNDSQIKIGDKFNLNSGNLFNPIGRTQQSMFFLANRAELNIGNNVGMSSTVIVCMNNVTIMDNVTIGGNVCIYDTDFHALDPNIRNNKVLDKIHSKSEPILIKENAFIGAHTTILKGVTIGKNVVIGAGSIVCKDVPDDEIWAGNPVKFIKKIC